MVQKRKLPTSPWTITVHPTDDPPSYFIEHPFGGYMELTTNEVTTAIDNGSAITQKPTRKQWELIEYRLSAQKE